MSNGDSSSLRGSRALDLTMADITLLVNSPTPDPIASRQGRPRRDGMPTCRVCARCHIAAGQRGPWASGASIDSGMAGGRSARPGRSPTLPPQVPVLSPSPASPKAAFAPRAGCGPPRRLPAGRRASTGGSPFLPRRAVESARPWRDRPNAGTTAGRAERRNVPPGGRPPERREPPRRAALEYPD
jgi:hypothetical protein